jgi:hypothetical protein
VKPVLQVMKHVGRWLAAADKMLHQKKAAGDKPPPYKQMETIIFMLHCKKYETV